MGRSRSGGGLAAIAGALLLALAACARSGGGGPVDPNTAPTSSTHSFFPIASGAHAVDCNTCHGDFASFKQFTCLACHTHDQGVTDQLHTSLGSTPGYAYDSASCLRCHATGERVPYDHAGITSTCAACHDTGAPFVALPTAGVGLDGGAFSHPDKGGNDCRACHVTTTWFGASGAPDGVSDPAMNVTVTAQVPTYSGTSIAGFSAQVEVLPMPMDHRSAALPAGAASACTNCHAAGGFYPGRLHDSLAALNLAQPSQCLECHLTSAPRGFVGPVATSPSRTPPSGEMKHDAVTWNEAGPTATPLLQQDCAACHSTSAPLAWTTAQKLHASLAAAAQPASCLDCHANSRPAAVVALASGLQFDHSAAMGECAACHVHGGAAQWTSWSGGQYHFAGASPSTCLPCHAGERPVSTAGWGAGFQASPFDYTTNTSGITHGAGQDCVACHAGPGTGAWGGTPKQNWAGGHFPHGAGTVAGSTCIACHMSQRPDLVLGAVAAAGMLGFDHSLNGTGDCFGCHQATVAAGSYAAYLNPASPSANSSDWKGGVAYPGATLISSSQSISVVETSLTRSGASQLVTGASAITATLYDAMLHTSAQVPPGMSPASSTDWPKCAKCHSVSPTDGSGTLANGVFHASVTAQALPQPAACNDCHAQMRPAGIVQRGGSNLQPMDHGASFAGGANVSQADCASCHQNPGATWADGAFHPNIGTARPQDCTVCHYTLMADAANADVISGTDFSMRHRSGQMSFQNCVVCHVGAMSQNPAIAVGAWKPGQFHPNLASQPLGCVDCHAISEPSAGASTQATLVYSLAEGGTASNGAQWMSHGSGSVAGKDCAFCHSADAQPSGSAWSKSDSFHVAVPSPASCQDCHGLGNGSTVAGSGNNLPVGLTDSSTLTSAASDPTTGVPAGTHDQITHADVNVSSRDCAACHTQRGASTVPGVQGKEWAQASFHASLTGPLVMDGTTGRCSNCHLNVKPAAGFPLYDHSGLSAVPGTQDCTACHTWPGTGTASAANWLGASGAPAVVTLTPWSSGSSLTSNTVSFAHPTQYASCAQCHPGTNYARLIDYDHEGLTANVSINGNAVTSPMNLGSSAYGPANPTFCVHCHNGGSPWVSTSGLSSPIAADTASGSTTVNTASTTALVTGMTIRGAGIPSTTTTTSNFSASTTSGSVTVTTSSTVTLQAGTPISGPGIPAGDTVAVSVRSANTFDLTAPATATASGVTLTATLTSPLTVTIKSIASATSFVISTAANATLSGASLTVTHQSITQAAIGSHQSSTAADDCTSCHYAGSRIASLTPPTAGVFSTGRITGN